jgi:cbb3-type cytochrome oxidase maturation protein
MNVIILLVVISVTVASLFLGAYFWSVKTGQFDDMDSPAVRMLLDDVKNNNNSSIEKKINSSDKTSNNKIK